MHRRHPLPRLWLMTDERQGEALWDAVERLPRGAGIVFRHHSLPPGERRALFARLRAAARRRGLVLLAAGPPLPGADGTHNRKIGRGIRSFSVHGPDELRSALRSGADLVFVSPVFPTRSHPGAAALGPLRFARLARRSPVPVIALGGMNAARAKRLRGAYGWAGIDALTCGERSVRT